jgi:hypothetical protein
MTEQMMTRKVQKRALGLLKLAVSDIAGDPQAIADNLLHALTLRRAETASVIRGPWHRSAATLPASKPDRAVTLH